MCFRNINYSVGFGWNLIKNNAEYTPFGLDEGDREIYEQKSLFKVIYPCYDSFGKDAFRLPVQQELLAYPDNLLRQMVKPLSLVNKQYTEQLLPKKDGKYLAMIYRSKYKNDNPHCYNENLGETDCAKDLKFKDTLQ